MKQKDIQKVLKKLYEENAVKLTNEDDMEFDLECENEVCKVYQYDEDGDVTELDADDIVNVFLPFVFDCISEIIWNEL
jgi:hypothetical protein